MAGFIMPSTHKTRTGLLIIGAIVIPIMIVLLVITAIAGIPALLIVMLIITVLVVGSIFYTGYVWFKPVFQEPDPDQLRVSEVTYSQAREGASPKVIHCTVVFPESRRDEVRTMQLERTLAANSHSHSRHHHRTASDSTSPIVEANPNSDTLTRQESVGDGTIYENKAYNSENGEEYEA
ncbi:uncharacterized protein LOC144359408 [Saccoglossus kowalevskii]